MDILSVCPLRVAPFLWEPRPSAWVLTVIVKATFALRPGEALLAAEQEPLRAEDERWGQDPSRSVRAPADLLPIKLHPELIVTGHAYSPGGRPTKVLHARVAVGSVDKSIEVHADRTLGPDGALHEGAPFTSFPLVYERAAGGPGTTNPVGIHAGKDALGVRLLPNMVRPSAPLPSPDAPLDPIGLGPLAPEWPGRIEKLGRHAELARMSLQGQILPPDVDMAFFSQAPVDQWLSALREDEWIALENLHPSEPRLVTRLPGLRPAVFIDKPGRAPQKVAARPDTLWIDTDRALATLTYRVPVAIEKPDEPGRVLVGMEPPGLEAKWEDVANLAEARRPRTTAQSSVPPPLCPEDDQAPPRVSPPRAPRMTSASETMVWQIAPKSPQPEAPAPQPSAPSPDIVELLFFEPSVVPRVRRVAKALAAGARSQDVDLDEPGSPDAQERREIFEWLVQGQAMDRQGIAAVMEGAVRDDGKFVPPLALVAGELSLDFDPVPLLHVALGWAEAELDPANEKARVALERARKAVDRGPCLSLPLARELSSRLLEALEMAPDDPRITESLLIARHYESCALFGSVHVRGRLVPANAEAPLVVYLSAFRANLLPLYRTFSVRMLCEVHRRLDERQSEPFALRALALAWVTKRQTKEHR